MGRNIHHDSISVAILRAIGAGTLLLASLVAPGLARALPMVLGTGKRYPSKGSIAKTVMRLQKRGLIRFSKRKSKRHIALTERGEDFLHSYAWDNVRIQKPKKWDGLWRVIIFDIPEEQRAGRVALQQTLRRLKFCAMQRSVYVFPYACKRELFMVLKENRMEEYVEYFETKSLGTAESRIRSFFKNTPL